MPWRMNPDQTIRAGKEISLSPAQQQKRLTPPNQPIAMMTKSACNERWKQLEQNWRKLENQFALKSGAFLQSPVSPVPYRDENWSGETDPRNFSKPPRRQANKPRAHNARGAAASQTRWALICPQQIPSQFSGGRPRGGPALTRCAKPSA